MDRRDRDPTGGDRREIGTGFVVEARVRAVDPVAPAALLLALELELVAVDALAEARHLDAVGLACRDVHVEQRRRRQRHVLHALDETRDEARGDLKSEATVEAVVERARARLLGDGDRGQPEHDALERRRDRARVGDVVAEIGAVVDPRDDYIGGEAVDQTEPRQAHAVDRRAVGRIAAGPVLERHLGHPQRPAGGDRTRHRRAVSVGCDHREAHAAADLRAPCASPAAPRPRSRRRWSAGRSTCAPPA